MILSAWLILILVIITPLPYGTDRNLRRIPWVTYGIIIINVAVYLITQPDRMADGGGALFQHWGVIPAYPKPTALFTSLFLHVSFVHLLWNMVFLWLFGPHVEEVLGRITYLVLYIGGGITAFLLHTAVITLVAMHKMPAYQPLVGASGAISAILAPFAVRYYRSFIKLIWLPGYLIKHPLGNLEVPAFAALMIWVLQNLLGGIRGIFYPDTGGIAYWAHIGGFVFGFVTAELTGLYREGCQEYLLHDARTAVSRGLVSYPEAIRKYRAYLELNPHNNKIRLELLTAVAGIARSDGNLQVLSEAGAEMTGAIRRFIQDGDHAGAVSAASSAIRLDVLLDLTNAEILRLSVMAQDMGDVRTSSHFLQVLINEKEKSSEDEIARLRLGQLLISSDPEQAKMILQSLITKYPASQWLSFTKQLLSQIELSQNNFKNKPFIM